MRKKPCQHLSSSLDIIQNRSSLCKIKVVRRKHSCSLVIYDTSQKWSFLPISTDIGAFKRTQLSGQRVYGGMHNNGREVTAYNYGFRCPGAARHFKVAAEKGLCSGSKRLTAAIGG